MGVGVVSNDVALFYHAGGNLRAVLQIRHCNKKGGGHLLFLQHIEDFCCIAVFIATVKGQIQYLLRRFGIERKRMVFVK